jgi:hypothetical protein
MEAIDLLLMSGEIMSIPSVSNGVVIFSIVIEVMQGQLYYIIYGWSGKWSFLDEYLMGTLGRLHGNIGALHGEVLDAGISVSLLEHALLVVEMTEDGLWYILYSVDSEGFSGVEEVIYILNE